MTLVFLSSCSEDNNGINIFTVEDDKQLGLQMEQEIQGNPAEYPAFTEPVFRSIPAYRTGQGFYPGYRPGGL